MSGLKLKVVLITGASSGIGAGTAKHFASLGCKLALVSRNEENLRKVADECKAAGAEDVVVLPKDLAVTDACIAAVKETVDHYKGESRA